MNIRRYGQLSSVLIWLKMCICELSFGGNKMFSVSVKIHASSFIKLVKNQLPLNFERMK